MNNIFKRNTAVKAAALALSVCMLATGCNAAGKTSSNIVAKVGDTQITYDKYKAELDRMLSQYGIKDTDENSENVKMIKENILNMMVDKEVYRKLETENKIVPSDAEKEDVKNQAKNWKDQNIQYLTTTYKNQGKENPEQAAKDEVEKYMTDNKIDEAFIEVGLTDELLAQKLYEKLTEKVNVSDEDVKAQYDKNVESAKTAYKADLSQYSTDLQSGNPVYYQPAGVFFVKHILIDVTDEEKQAIQKLRVTDNKPEEADKARDAALAKIKGNAEAALKRAKAGEDFNKLIEELGKDPGMTTPPTSETGYTMFEGCKTYVQEFTDASLALKKDGDMSGLVGTDYGYHIIKRVSTQAEAATPYEKVSEQLKAELTNTKKGEAFQAAVEKWKTDNKVELFKDKL